MGEIGFNESIRLLKGSNNPTTILLGNGINRNFGAGQSWLSFIENIYNQYSKVNADK